LISTGVRGLDHAINTLCGLHPEPLAGLLAANAAQLFVENLPRVTGPGSTRATRSNCQRASFYTGLGQMSVAHGFSHSMVHVIAPLVGAPHSATACVCMLAQARWQEGWADEQHRVVLQLLGRQDVPLHELLHSLLLELGMPTTLGELGVTESDLERAIELGVTNDRVMNNNLRPIRSADDLREILSLVAC
jgi:maleylacetate reductase